MLAYEPSNSKGVKRKETSLGILGIKIPSACSQCFLFVSGMIIQWSKNSFWNEKVENRYTKKNVAENKTAKPEYFKRSPHHMTQGSI